MKLAHLFHLESFFTLSVVSVMMLTLITRVIGLSYNSPFNDEAIYIIVGLMGLFERDWWTYNASAWIPGVQYFYPSMTAIAYNIGGIEGSRFLNVLLGVFTVEILFLITSSIHHQINNLRKISFSSVIAGLTTAVIIGGSEISHYVSRLATYDMPSFMFLFLGILLLLHNTPVKAGNRYFLASLFLSLSYFAKIITGMYIPFIILFFYFRTKQIGERNFAFFKKYFMFPLFTIAAIFALFSFSSLSGYYLNQQSLTKASFSEITALILETSKLPLYFALIGVIGLTLKKQFRTIFFLSFAAFLIVGFHLVTSRTLSMDKHLFLMNAFLAIISGLGIGNLISLIKPTVLKAAVSIALVIVFFNYWMVGYSNISSYNNKWQNMSVISTPLNQIVKPGDKILAESGSAVILETYYKNYPPNTSTFDWLQYQNKTGDEAFQMAVRDGYFDIIQLESEENSKSERNDRLSKLVRKSMEENYYLVFEQNGFLLYRRAY